MRVPSEILRTVVFLGHKDPDEKTRFFYTDTGFMVSVPSAAPRQNYTYLVTSKHGALKLGSEFIVRVNRKDGGAEDVPTGGKFQWYCHPSDPFVDVALGPLNFPINEYDYSCVPRSMFWTREDVERNDLIGLGDETFVAGLFPELEGKRRNSPIFHFGNLIGLPSEKIVIEIEDGKKGPADAYLVEVRSIKGLSGSPVFLSKPLMIDLSGIVNYDHYVHPTGEVEDTPPIFYATGPFCFLGLMHGHWKYPLGDLAKFFPAIEDGLHSGVAVVVPARKIAEVLDHPDLMQFRKIGDERIRERQIQDAPTPSRDSGNKPKNRDVAIPPINRDDFFDALKKATRKRKP
jgi:hypothetical protein